MRADARLLVKESVGSTAPLRHHSPIHAREKEAAGMGRRQADALRPLDRPALVVWGAHDPYLPVALAQRLIRDTGVIRRSAGVPAAAEASELTAP